MTTITNSILIDRKPAIFIRIRRREERANMTRIKAALESRPETLT